MDWSLLAAVVVIVLTGLALILLLLDGDEAPRERGRDPGT